MKKQFIQLVFFGFAMVLTKTSLACQPPAYPTESAKMALSENGRFLVKIIPGIWSAIPKYPDKRFGQPRVLKRHPINLAFEIQDDGQLKPLWSVKVDQPQQLPMFTFSGDHGHFISDDGKMLYVLKNLKYIFPDKDPPVLVLYKEGKKIRNYNIAEFGNPGGVVDCMGSFWWKRIRVLNNELVIDTQERVHGNNGASQIAPNLKYYINLKTGRLFQRD